MSEVPLDWPINGVSDQAAQGAQEPGTTMDADNVKTFDAALGRERGGVREGTVKVVNAQVSGSNAVRDMFQVSYASAQFTYAQATQGAAVEEWKVKTPLTSDCRAVQTDFERNVYVLDGKAGVAKYNTDGKLVWKFVLPVASQSHICRAFLVDDEGAIYVAVSEGYPQKTAKLFKYRVRDVGSSVPNKEWEIGESDPNRSTVLEGYVEQMVLRDGFLFCAVNFPDRGAANIIAYRLINTSAPEEAWRREQVPYPINGMDVRDKDGALFTCHQRNTTRAYDGRSPDTTKIAVDWTPDRLDSFEQRVWCILDASDLDADGTFNSAYQNGDPVLEWGDSSGNGRVALDYATAGLTAPTSCTAPTLNKNKQFAGQDTVVFSNPVAGLDKAHTGLVSLANPSTTSLTGNSQRTLLPCYAGAKASVFMVLRTADTGSTIRAPLGQVYTPSSTYRGVFINANTTGGSGFTAATGIACLHQSLSSGGTAGPYAAYDGTKGFAVVGFTFHTSVAASTGTNAVNGTSCTNSTFTGSNFTTVERTQLGRLASTVLGVTAAGTGIQPYDGELAYMLVLRDYNAGADIISSTEFDKVIGALHWRFGVADKLPSGHTYRNQPPTADPLPGTTDSPYLYLTDTEAMLVKWDPNKAAARWVVKDDSTSSAVGLGGLGYGVAVPDSGDDRFVFSVGPISEGGAATSTLTQAQLLTRQAVVRRIADNGDSASVSGSGTWEDRWGTSASPIQPDYAFPRLAVSGITPNVDAYNPTSTDQIYGLANLYVPYHTSTTSTPAVYQYLSSGTAAGGGTETPPDRTFTLATLSRGYAVAVEREIPEYEPGLFNSIPDEKIIVGTPKEGISDEAVTQIRCVNATRSAVAARTSYVVAVAGSAFGRVTSTSVGTPVSTIGLSSTGRVSMCALFSRIYGTDGVTYFQIDPRNPALDGLIRPLTPFGSGSYPKKASLFASCFQRLIMARGVDPHVLFFTGVGDPTDADTRPAELTGYEAVTIPLDEPVTTLIPATDDLLFVGCAGKVFRITGDPAQGGKPDRIKDLAGMPLGEPWCRDPYGRLFIFETHGSVSMLGADGASKSISDGRIKRRLEAIDLTTHEIRMAWDQPARGLIVVAIPLGAAEAPTQAYFFEHETGAWWPYTLPYVVRSLRSIDVDGTGNRAVWFGCGDGYVRRFSRTAQDDDGAAIPWNVFFGWMPSPHAPFQARFSRPRLTLAHGLRGCSGSLHVSDDAGDIGDAVTTFQLDAGENDTLPDVARGNHVGIKLFGTLPFAYESGAIQAAAAGMRRRVGT